MTKIKDIYQYLDRETAPFETAMDYDNVGLLVGDGETEASKVLLALDITKQAVDEADQMGAQLIISHHPVIFEPLRRLPADSAVYRLARCQIAAICAHTNLDMAEYGVNYHFAQRLGLCQTQALALYRGRSEALHGNMEREFSPEEFAVHVKRQLGCGGIQYVPGRKPIKRVALCSGAGGSLLEAAIAGGADAFVTGECKHSLLISAQNAGITLVLAGHFATEDVVIEPLRRELEQHFPDTAFFKAASVQDPVRYVADTRE